MRDRLVHHYLGHLEIVWEVVIHDLPPLKAVVVAMLKTRCQISEFDEKPRGVR